MTDADIKVLDMPCLVCKRSNRFHRVFWSPTVHGYVKQWIDEAYAIEPLIDSRDHHTILNNLEYLEYLEYQYERSQNER